MEVKANKVCYLHIGIHIVSSEDFLFLTHQPTLRINSLKNPGYQIKIVLVLRPLAAHILSLYTQLLANNTSMTFTFEEMLEKIITTGTFHFYRDEVYYSDYNKIIQCWQESQIDEVKVLTYKKYHSTIFKCNWIFKEMNNLTWQFEVQKHFYRSNKLFAKSHQCHLNPKP